jgi:DNA-binding CsgD family transcriptional regulator/PAS domain-containing protein
MKRLYREGHDSVPKYAARPSTSRAAAVRIQNRLGKAADRYSGRNGDGLGEQRAAAELIDVKLGTSQANVSRSASMQPRRPYLKRDSPFPLGPARQSFGLAPGFHIYGSDKANANLNRNRNAATNDGGTLSFGWPPTSNGMRVSMANCSQHGFGASMSKGDLYVGAVEAIYASGVDRERIPDALLATSRLLGGPGATLEVIDKKTRRLVSFHSAGLPSPAGARYSEHFAATNPRLPMVLRQRVGEVGFDYQALDERAMARDSFYSEFLPELGLRYFISAVLEQTRDTLSVVSVQRTRRQGHVDASGISMMQRLFPHLQKAHDMRTRLQAAPEREAALEDALDLLTDGIALLRKDGRIVYANQALRALSAGGHDFRIDRDVVEFATPDLRARFTGALGAVVQVREPQAAIGRTDFAVPRDNGLPAYTVSVRPLMRDWPEPIGDTLAVAMLLIHDPLQRNATASAMLQELFGLTNAEAHLVQALGTGMTAIDYAQSRNISITTVYTHLRRTREKTGWKSVAELTRRFGELNVALRAN